MFERVEAQFWIPEQAKLNVDRVMGSNGKVMREMDFSVFGNPELIDTEVVNRGTRVGEVAMLLSEELENVDGGDDGHFFGTGTRVHIDMFVQYPPSGGDHPAGFIRRNESELMEFLLDALEYEIVEKDSVVSHEITKMCLPGHGGIVVNIKEVE